MSDDYKEYKEQQSICNGSKFTTEIILSIIIIIILCFIFIFIYLIKTITKPAFFVISPKTGLEPKKINI